ncbi:MAG TPA: complex I subunit 1 family protein [Polyangiaceae bacterium]|jgi:NADH-quinone oxidoreductase subunit H|nr:complex I subunit 1 family protein [Polyangiaceae bacterium]
MTVMQVVWALVKILIMVMFVLNLAAILTWADRRQSSMIQDRIGPNRAVLKIFGKEFRLLGLLHPAADGLKFFTKEDFMPPNADPLLFTLAPIIAMGMVFTLVATIPFGDTICPHEFTVAWPNIFVGPAVPAVGVCTADARTGYYPIDLMVAPLGVGLLFVFAMAGQSIIGAAIAGWASDNKFSLMGALRAASQMVSYEVTLGMSLIGALMLYGTIQLDQMVRWQSDHAWGIFVQPLAFFLFFTASVAENKRIPFDLPEAESELVSGYFTEYAGMKFGMFYFAEYAEVVTGSMLLVTIFLGGWSLPFLHRDGLTIQFGSLKLVHSLVPHVWMTIIGVLAFFGKTIAVCWVQTFVRWTLPRFRYDQLMKLGWRILLPASLANILVTGVIALAVYTAGPAVGHALQVAADLSQALVAALITVLFVRGVIGAFAPLSHPRSLIGYSAVVAAKRGGTKATPMQA